MVGISRSPSIPKNSASILANLTIKIVQRLSGELGKHLKGLLYRQDERSAVILIAESNNECWRRFVFIKEICHLFLDEREIFTVTIQTTPFFPGRPSRHDPPLHSLIGAGYEQATQQA